LVVKVVETRENYNASQARQENKATPENPRSNLVDFTTVSPTGRRTDALFHDYYSPNQKFASLTGQVFLPPAILGSHELWFFVLYLQ